MMTHVKSRRKINLCGAAALLSGLGGCVSYSYVDDHNVAHVIGFVDFSQKTASGDSTRGANTELMHVTSVGLHAYSWPQQDRGLVLGYNNETLIPLPANGCIDITSANICAAADSFQNKD